MEGLRGPGGIKKPAGIRPERERLGSFGTEITARPEPPGQAEDPLERAAMQGVDGTLPERIIWKWLEQARHLYEAQREELGGRLIAGGQVIDFVVHDLGPRPVALRVQGEYWHGPQFPGRMAADDDAAMRLRAAGYVVVDLWEADVYAAAEGDRVGAYVMGEIAEG